MNQEYYIILSLFALVLAGLGFVYYSIELTQSAETHISNLQSFPTGSLVTISGQISKLSKSSSGNIYWTVDDGTGEITVPLLGSMAGSYKDIQKNSFVVVTGLTSEYKNELEVTPKQIEVS